MISSFPSRFFALQLCLCLSGMLHAQKWQWVSPTPQDAEYIDIAACPDGDVVTLYEGSDNGYFLQIHDSSGRERNRTEFYFQNTYGNCLFEADVDREGNVYVISRQTLDETMISEAPYREESEDEDIDREVIAYSYIVMEKYSADMELISSQRLLKLSDNDYAIDVCEFVIDDAGHFWLSGVTDDSDYDFKEKTIHPGTGGGMFVMRLPSGEMKNAWIRSFAESGSCCTYGADSYHLAVNKDGMCIVSGTFRGDLKLSNGTVLRYVENKTFEGEMFVVAMNDKGDIKWSQQMDAPSYDRDVVALSDGTFVISGFFVEATKLSTYKLPAGKTNGFFLMKLNPANGKIRQVYLNDTSAISHLEAGTNNDFYCTFLRNNSGTVQEVYHFTHKLEAERLTRFTGHKPQVIVMHGELYCAGSYGWNAAFGDRKPNWLYIGGDSSSWGSFLAKCSLAITSE
jgi:hypothetical protein